MDTFSLFVKIWVRQFRLSTLKNINYSQTIYIVRIQINFKFTLFKKEIISSSIVVIIALVKVSITAATASTKAAVVVKVVEVVVVGVAAPLTAVVVVA